MRVHSLPVMDSGERTNICFVGYGVDESTVIVMDHNTAKSAARILRS